MSTARQRMGIAVLWITLGTCLTDRASAVVIVPTEQQFIASGTFKDGATLGGTLTIDITDGSPTTSNLTVTPSGSNAIPFANIVSYGPKTDAYEIFLTNKVNLYYLDLYLPTQSLVGYSGGPIEGTASSPSGDISSYGPPDPDLISGSLTAVPEPSSLWLSGIAITIGGLGLFARHRRNRGRGESGSPRFASA